MRYGYSGRILRVDLTRGTTAVEEWAEATYRLYPGGKALAAYILLASLQNGATASITLTVSKTQLASLLGTIPETLSRILAKMSKQGLIGIEGAVITLLDREGLTALAEGELRL